MADVFVSYAKIDRAHAEKLATDLKAGGLTVWWDADLYASQDYHDTILAALNASKVAIVIWSPSAKKSEWVRDEARRAHAKKKLVPTYLPPFSIDDIPLGFGDIQTVDVNDRAAIYDALRKLGVFVSLQARPVQPPLAQLVPKPPSQGQLSDLIAELHRAAPKAPAKPTDRLEPFMKLVGQTEPFKRFVPGSGMSAPPFVVLDWQSEPVQAVARRFLNDAALSHSARLVDKTLHTGIRMFDRDVSEFALALSTLAHAVSGEDQKVLAAFLVRLQGICNEIGVERI